MSRLASLIVRAAAALLPTPLKPWGTAMRAEVATITAPAAALVFALGCLGAAARETALFHLMGHAETMIASPRRLTALCAIAATGLGLVYMALGGAPLSYVVINTGALALGFATVVLAGHFGRVEAGIVSFALGGLLLLLTFTGVTVEGATRWISMAGVAIQPSLVLLPVLAVTFACRRDSASLAGIALAALALALQPDRAMAGAVFAGMAALALVRAERNVLLAAAISAAGFLAAMVQPDTQGAMPFVDRILYTAFDVHPLAGAAVLLGSVLLVVPALVGLLTDPTGRAAHATFGALWLTMIGAAALGNYPTPVVGYGGSAILGYVLCLLALPRRTAPAKDGAATGRADTAPPLYLPFLPFPPTGKPC